MAIEKNGSKGTAESRLIRQQMVKLGLSSELVAVKLDLANSSNVSHWRTGRRPVPVQYAPKLANMLEIDDPGRICAAWRQVVTPVLNFYGVSAMPKLTRSEPTEMERMDMRIKELRAAMTALTAGMIRHRPTEARDVADTIRKHATPRERRSGLLAEMLQAIDAASPALLPPPDPKP